jgi:hypothetical protein
VTPATGALAAFLTAFGGSWVCAPTGPGAAYAHATRWQIGAIAGNPWTRVAYAAHGAGGHAIVGYLPFERTWIYQDYHDDGSFADNRSPGPDAGGVWTWTGVYVNDRRMVHYAVQWRRADDRIERKYGVLLGTSFRAASGDVCRRS